MRIQADHWAAILDFCETNPEIITNKFNGSKGRESLQQKWTELTILLNSLGLGEKSTQEWKKSIIDWKSKTKVKATAICNYVSGTGGGPQSTSLTSYEERLLSIMGKVAIHGDEGIKEIGLKRPGEAQPVLSTHPKMQKTCLISVKKDKCEPYQENKEKTYKFPPSHQFIPQKKIIIDQSLNQLSSTVQNHSEGKSFLISSDVLPTSASTLCINSSCIPKNSTTSMYNKQGIDETSFSAKTSYGLRNSVTPFKDQLENQAPTWQQERESYSNMPLTPMPAPSIDTYTLPKNSSCNKRERDAPVTTTCVLANSVSPLNGQLENRAPGMQEEKKSLLTYSTIPLTSAPALNIDNHITANNSSYNDKQKTDAASYGLRNSVPSFNGQLKNQASRFQQNRSTRRRESILSQQLETMNDSVLQVLNSINSNISNIAMHLADLVEVMKDLKK